MARLMKSELIRVLHEIDSTRVVLNDAAHHNKLSVELVEELIGVVEDLNTNPTGRLTIEGSHATFCAGFDLDGLKDSTNEVLAWRFLRIGYLLELLYAYPGVTVAVARGPAIGAGADIFAACDIRVASPSVYFRFPGAQFGVILGSRRLVSLVGGAAAAQWITVGNTIDSASALNVGLVTHLQDLTNADVETIALDVVPPINQRRGRQVAAIMNRPEPAVGLADLAMSINLSTDLKAQMLTYINLRLRDGKD